MFRLRWLLLSMFVWLLFGCPGPKPSNQDVNAGSAGSTVYDTSDRSNAGVQDFRVEEDPQIHRLDDSIDSDRLGIGGRNRLSSVDWVPVFFEFDRADLTEDAKQALTKYASSLKTDPDVFVLLEGHCDSRGTEDYNMALGERRAQSVKRFLQQLGIPPDRLKTISYGELRPLLEGNNEASWSRNRRVSFTF